MLARIGVMRALNRHVERGVQSGSEGPSLGPPEAGAGSMTTWAVRRRAARNESTCLSLNPGSGLGCVQS